MIGAPRRAAISRADPAFSAPAPTPGTLDLNCALRSIGFSIGDNCSSYIAANGTYSAVSSRTKKENFESLNFDDILNKLDRLPVMKWNFKKESPTIKHIGPFAEGFHEASS